MGKAMDVNGGKNFVFTLCTLKISINDDISCRVCGLDDNEDVLLICDECGNG